MTDMKQPEALRLAKTLEALGDYNFNTEAAAELRRQHAEIEALRAKLNELDKQEHAAFVNEQGFIVERDDMQISSGEKLYVAAGARPVELAPAGEYPPLPEWSKMDNLGGLVPSEIRRELCAYIDADRAMRAAQPAPAAQDDAKDAARWRYAVEIGGNQRMNWLDVYNDWDGEGSFVDAIDAARAADKKEPTNGND
jgi:hypothetical protein